MNVDFSLVLLDEKRDWHNLYKALEYLDRGGFTTDFSNNKRERLKQTANALVRHRDGKVPLPAKPMTLGEGVKLIHAIIEAACMKVLANR